MSTSTPPLWRITLASLTPYYSHMLTTKQIAAGETLPRQLCCLFICSGEWESRHKALTLFGSIVTGLGGSMLGGINGKSSAGGKFCLPARASANPRESASMISQTALRCGLRPRVLSIANLECASSSGYLGGWTMDQELSSFAAIQGRWRGCIDHYLTLDHEAGTCPRPALLRDLHVGLPPVDSLIMRAVVSQTRGGRPHTLGYQDGIHFYKMSPSEIESALRRLEASGWIGGWARRDGVRQDGPVFDVVRGELSAHLSNSDLLDAGSFDRVMPGLPGMPF